MSKFSDQAIPPISEAEAEKAQHSICRIHNGLVCETGDKEGAVFFCPIGRQWWRYTNKRPNGLYAPLSYPKSGAV